MQISSSVRSRILIGFLCLFLFGCGSSNDGASDSNENEPTLAEAAADLPKTGTVNVASTNDGSSTQTNQGSSAATTPTTTVAPTSSSSSIAHVMRRFLWKPVSEGNGLLVVLVDPVGVRIEVFGSVSETLTDHGPSNERGTTARGSFAGCNYGSGVQVKFYSRSGQQMGFTNGVSTVRIPNGCERVEFNL